jgi:uncharacterized flavoprotein (TIGR03862 family)
VTPAAGRHAPASRPRLVVVGGGPAGLMAAEAACAAGVDVDLYEAKGSVGRKFLIAGRGGLNLTHSAPRDAFASRYGERAPQVGAWLDAFPPSTLRDWASGLGVDSFVGSSGRVFPTDMQAAPLLRAWVRRLREAGVRFHVRHRCTGLRRAGEGYALDLETPDGPCVLHADAMVLALGGGSWPQLGSDGAWQAWLPPIGVESTPLESANCGFDVDWSGPFAARFAGAPLKPAILRVDDGDPDVRPVQGEFVVTAHGVEGSLLYALSARLRAAIRRGGQARLLVDLAPGRSVDALATALARPRKGRSTSEFLRRVAGIDGLRAGLARELLPPPDYGRPRELAAALKAAPLVLLRPRPIAEAISSAGGVRLESLDDTLMAERAPGLFIAGEMLDWDAPTGGYLLSACFASGRVAGVAAAKWLHGRRA